MFARVPDTQNKNRRVSDFVTDLVGANENTTQLSWCKFRKRFAAPGVQTKPADAIHNALYGLRGRRWMDERQILVMASKIR